MNMSDALPFFRASSICLISRSVALARRRRRPRPRRLRRLAGGGKDAAPCRLHVGDRMVGVGLGEAVRCEAFGLDWTGLRRGRRLSKGWFTYLRH